MAKFVIEMNQENGNIEIKGSKKVIGSINEAISILTEAGFTAGVAHSMLAQYVPVEFEAYKQKLKMFSMGEEGGDIIFVGKYSTSKKGIKLAIKKALDKILETQHSFNHECVGCPDSVDEEDTEIVSPDQMP